MPRIVSSVHDAVALAAVCRRLGLDPPREQTIRLDGQGVSGWVVLLPGVRHEVVFDTLTGLIVYHPLDNAHDRYARIVAFIDRYYDIRSRLRRGNPSQSGRPAPPGGSASDSRTSLLNTSAW